MTVKKKRVSDGGSRGAVRHNTPLVFLLLSSLLLFGGYHDFTVLPIGAILALLLLFEAKKSAGLPLPSLPVLGCLAAVAAGNLLAIPFAVSGGMAFTGFLRTVVWLLFFLYAATYSPAERRNILLTAADFGAVLCVISLIPFIFDRLSGISDSNGRIDGFFQYANSYSLFLLICFVLILMREERRRIDWAELAVLFLGILLSGSRGVFLLMIAALVFLGGIAVLRKGQWRAVLLIVLAGAALCAAAAVLSDGLVLRRLAAITTGSSSVNGRLLYYLDGLRILKDHPLGIGRGGYLYLQPLYQTGVYTLKHIHNIYLQAALDGGVLAGLGMTALPVLLLLRRRQPMPERLIIALIAAHGLIDFDSEYTALVFLLLLCGSGEDKKLPLPGIVPVKGGCVALALIMTILSVPYTLSFLGSARGAYALWPFDLTLAEERLQHCATMEEAETIADRILSSTDTSLLAWDCKFSAARDQGDYPAMTHAKFQYLRFNPYRTEVWQEFTALLEEACTADSANTADYAQLAAGANILMKEVQEQTHPLAWRIADKPDFDSLGTISDRLQILEERQH